MENDVNKTFSLSLEIQNVMEQIKMGLKDLQTPCKPQEIQFDMFNHLSSGFERLLKYGICYGMFCKNNIFPKLEEIKTHDISNLLEIYVNDYFSTSLPALMSDYEFLTTDMELKILIKILSDFACGGRYDNFNTVMGYNSEMGDIQQRWNKLESDFIINNEQLNKNYIEGHDPKYVDQEVNKHFVSIFERLARAIVRQFTLGNIKDAGRDIGAYNHFLSLKDNDFGSNNYDLLLNKAEKKEKQQKYQHINGYKRKVIYKEEFVKQFDKLWPFKNTNVVTVEKSSDGCVFIIISGNVYALNGITGSRYHLPFAYQYDETFYGIDMGDFFNLAFSL